MNNPLFIYMLFAIIAEHILVAGVVVYFLVRRLKYARAASKYLHQLQPTPSFNIIETKNLYLEQKIFIETPEVGVYIKRLYRTRSHKHTIVNSLLYILKGKAHVTMGNKQFIIKPRQFLYVPALVVHDWKVLHPYQYVEYIEIANPSFVYAPPDDTVWEK